MCNTIEMEVIETMFLQFILVIQCCVLHYIIVLSMITTHMFESRALKRHSKWYNNTDVRL